MDEFFVPAPSTSTKNFVFVSYREIIIKRATLHTTYWLRFLAVTTDNILMWAGSSCPLNEWGTSELSKIQILQQNLQSETPAELNGKESLLLAKINGNPSEISVIKPRREIHKNYCE